MKRSLALFLIALWLVACSETPSASGPTEPVATLSWSAAAPAPLARFEAQSAVVGGKFFVFGGYTDPDIIPTAFDANMYDPVTDTWTRLPDLPRPMTHAGTAADEENIYFAGGVVGSAQPLEAAKLSATTEVWRYHVPSGIWSAMPPLPEPRGAGALAVVGRNLHFFGGTMTDRYTEVGDHWILALDGSAQWQAAPPLPNPRNHLSSAVVGGKLYVIGGQHGHNETLVTQRSVHLWDPEQGAWSERASLPYGLGHTSNATVVYGGRIYVLGGETERFVYSSEVLVYDPASDSWTTTTPFTNAEHSLLAGVVGDEVIVTGGSSLSVRTVRGAFSSAD